MRVTRFRISAFLLLSTGLLLSAQDADQLLPDLQITASPVVEGSEATAYGGWITTIGAEQIENLNAQDLASALRRTPGVTISRYNRIGSFGGADGGAVFIRGMGSTRPGADIVTMIDGVPILNPVWNHPLLDLNPIDAADSIVVFKGPHPAAFGNAFSAIDMIPARRSEEGLSTRLRLAYGSDATFISGVEQEGRQGQFDWGLGGAYRTSDGHRFEADGRMGNLRLRLGFELDPHWYASAHLIRTDNRASDPGPEGNPGARDGVYETRNWVGIARLAHEFESVSGYLALYGTKGDGEWYDQAGRADDTLNDWETWGVRWLEDILLQENTSLRIGLDQDVTYGEADFSTDAGMQSTFERTRLSLTSPYLALEHILGDESGWHAIPSAGVRWYEHNEFDSEWSPHAGLRIGFRDTEWHLYYARGIVYPGLNVVVFSENVIAPLGSSWQDLEAEVVDHWETGITHRFGPRVEASITFFYDDGEDRYVFYRSGATPGPPNQWENVEEFEIYGAEFELHLRPTQRISAFLGMTALEAEPEDLPYTPDWSASAGLNVDLTDRLHWSIDAEFVDDMPVLAQARLRDSLNTVSVGSHFLINTKLSLDMNLGNEINGTVFLAVENVTDADYEYLPDYPMPGISTMAGLEIEF